MSRASELARFWAKVDLHGPLRSPYLGPCWTWTANVCGGYGYFWSSVLRKKVRAHRLAYELFHGPIPDGLELDHLCRVRNCVNPAHLEPVTHLENQRRGNVGDYWRQKTTCPRGHPYDVTYGTRGTRRACRTCNSASGRRARQAA